MHELLTSPPSWLHSLIYFISGVALLAIVLGFVTYGVLTDRKVIGFMQSRIGPNRTGGRFGLLQTVADVLKLLIKEDVIPHRADKPLYVLAPAIVFAPAFAVLAVIPFSANLQFAHIGVGLLYYLAVSGIATIGILTGGWASNNKYSLIGGMRAVAQMISYEIPLIMSVVGVIMVTGSLNLTDIVMKQEHLAFFIMQPIGFVIFLIAALAELSRTPFDLPEAESELVAGFHTEYSGFRWAIIMLSEYTSMFGFSALMTAVFLGGWLPIPGLGFIPGIVWFSLKFMLVVFFLVWLRATMPRLRADQLMEFAWKILLPVALANIFLTAVWQLIF